MQRPSMLYTLVVALLKLIARLLIAVGRGMRVEGRENVPDQGPILVTPNHISDSDPALVGMTLPRPAYFMAKSELFAVPVFGPLLRFLRGFPVKRGQPDRSALRKAEELLKASEALVVFPEGQLSETGALQPLNPGVVLIAMRSGAPVLPVGLIGTDALLPYGKLIPKPAGRRIVVRYGRPIPVEELTGGLSGKAGLQRGVEVLSAALAELTAQPAHQLPPVTSAGGDRTFRAEGVARGGVENELTH